MTQSFPVTIPNTEVRMLRSTVVDQEYQLFVGFPHGYANGQKAFPVLYLLDANIGFGIVEFLRMLQHVQEAPEFLLVGIGYPVNHFGETLAFRQRDYTPTADPVTHAQQPHTPPATGGADHFLRFVGEELMPFIAANYRVVADDCGIAGVSLGGLFACYTLFHQPHLFKRYILISPSLWWDNGVTFAYEQAFAAIHTALNARLFISAGSLEAADIKDNVLRLSGNLKERHYNGFHLQTQILAGETHVSGVAAALCQGVREVYKM